MTKDQQTTERDKRKKNKTGTRGRKCYKKTLLSTVFEDNITPIREKYIKEHSENKSSSKFRKQ